MKEGKDYTWIAIIVAAVLVSVVIIYSAGVISSSVLSASQLNSNGNFKVYNSSLQNNSAVNSNPNTASKGLSVPLGSDYIGNASAPNQIVEFADYQCVYCGLFYNESNQALMNYVNSGKAVFAFRDFVLIGPDSLTAAEAARCAGDQGKYWQYHDYLYSHQGGENSGWAGVSNLEYYAQKLGLNSTLFNSCLESGKYNSSVLQDTQTGRSLGVQGTPTFFINGKMYVGVLSPAQLQGILGS
ncbi:MAG: DsbA family protein [Candidatus Marsarchaeota archaeon]|nr:DsbA family protein [Candidatus Marsarchaeota archaeon]